MGSVKRSVWLCAVGLALPGCEAKPDEDATFGQVSDSSGSSGTSSDSSGMTEPGSGSNATASDGSAGTDSTTNGNSDTNGPKLDVGPGMDLGDVTGCNGQIPTTCAEAEDCDSTVGCQFYAVDLDQLDAGDALQFAVAVSNVQSAGVAAVTVERKNGANWETVEGPISIAALDEYTFLLDDQHQEESGVLPGSAYRITSDIPIVAYQFNPLNLVPTTASSDASMLFPVGTLDHINQVVGWEPLAGNGHGTYVTVAAAFDGTMVEITPSVATLPGPGVPAGVAGTPFTIALDEGDVVEVMTKTAGVTLSGTTVESDEDHPVAVFSGAECTNVLAYSCDHIETQLAGVRLWGDTFVASRVPPRLTGVPESSVWQIYASEDETTVTFDASPAVLGVPGGSIQLDRGEVQVLEVDGTMVEPGDFVVNADKPIAVVNYMTGSSLAGNIGDPAMVQIPPVEQFLPRYVVLVPTSWDTDVAVITRPPGVEVRLDGSAVSDADFVAVGSNWEVARVPVADGVHRFDGDAPFSVIVVGITDVDSYAYVGGIGAAVINPAPAG